MLDKSKVLNSTRDGLDIFKHYLPGDWRVGRNFKNPFYDDTKASCNIYFDRRSSMYRMKDFGNPHYDGDCFSIVGKIKNLDCTKDFAEILKQINEEMNLDLKNGYLQSQNRNSSAVKIESRNENTIKEQSYVAKSYTVFERSFTVKEIKFWKQYGITHEILKLYKVISLDEFSSENKDLKPFTMYSSEQEPIFGYFGKKYIKIYRPFSQIRFLYGGNLPESYCFGLEQLPAKGNTLFITGGEKDVLSLASKGFHAICFNSETSLIPESLIKKLSYRFKHILILYDVDKTGLEASLKHQRQLSGYGVNRLVLPLSGAKEEKDISDFFRMGNTKNDFNQLFLEFLDQLYNETMAILKPCEIDFSQPPLQSQTIISINDVPLGTQGNLLGLTGGEGTGKSNYVGSLIAGTLHQDGQIDTLGTHILPNIEGKAVLLYDTEQSENQLYKNIAGILKRSGRENKPDYFRAYCLAGMSRKERMQAILQSMDKFYYQFSGIHMVVIDGIADLIRGANDEGESVALIDELYRMAGIYKTCIVGVLHFTPNGLKLRGHLGSELQRKAASILSIEKDNNPQISVVKALKVRDGSPLDVPLIQFSWDKEKGMHIFIGEKTKEEKEKRKEIELANIARNLFSQQKRYTYSGLCEKLQSTMAVKDRTAKSYIKFMREKGLIVKDSENSYELKK
ncbi:toprim domain-containing protein [Chryseobacterium sp. EO14]|uniref:toprim domain-containing protein n=1 Tax=Chryseobacterium sp. EO14 TaxID=2950551 RepID=UPI00210953EA|nr:toprim domain-containing protein [Chryseobacterium sp. EO14]MCQ4139551.1 toprim domain-containing protein [Chryseobacterium sp. EO14]